METNPRYETLIAIDVGTQRVGVARARLGALLPQTLTTLEKPEQFIADIIELCDEEKAAAVVIGLPRGLSGQDTAQTAAVTEFGRQLESCLSVPVYWNDEALTSVAAEKELRGRGKPFSKGDIDALAAVYILEDFIASSKLRHPERLHA